MTYAPQIQFMFGFINQLTVAVFFSVAFYHNRNRIPSLFYFTFNLYLQAIGQLMSLIIFLTIGKETNTISFICYIVGAYFFYLGIAKFFGKDTKYILPIVLIILGTFLYNYLIKYYPTTYYAQIFGSLISLMYSIIYIANILAVLKKEDWYINSMIVFIVFYALFFIVFIVRLFSFIILTANHLNTEDLPFLLLSVTNLLPLIILMSVNFVIMGLIHGKIQHDFLLDSKEKENLVKELHEAASHDVLTSLYNRYAMEEKINKLIENSPQEGECNCLLMVDIDNFKMINDTYGHSMGDKVLKQASEICSVILEDDECLGRWGGDEFLFLFRCKNASKIVERINLILTTINEYPWQDLIHDTKIALTLSGGLVLIEKGMTKRKILTDADVYLYESKTQGRNQVRGKDLAIFTTPIN